MGGSVVSVQRARSLAVAWSTIRRRWRALEAHTRGRMSERYPPQSTTAHSPSNFMFCITLLSVFCTVRGRRRMIP